MAIGTGNLPNQNMVFTPFDILTAEEQNKLVENIEALADGSGIGDEAIDTVAVKDGAITEDKLGLTVQTWTPSFTGFSSNPTGGDYYYTRVGREVTLYIRQPNHGTSNSANFTFTLPIPASTDIGLYGAPCQVLSPGSGQGYVQISTASNPNIANVYTSYGGAGFPTSGSKRINECRISYLVD